MSKPDQFLIDPCCPASHMRIVIFSCVLVIAPTTPVHFEILSSLNTRLPTLGTSSRSVACRFTPIRG